MNHIRGIAPEHRLGAKVNANCAVEELQSIYVEGHAFSPKDGNGFEQHARAAVGEEARPPKVSCQVVFI